MHARVAHLHRARVRAQQKRQTVGVLELDVERVLHRARGMVLWIVERGEVVPVGLDLRPLGDVEAKRAPDGLDSLPGAHDRMDAAASATAAGKRDVERFLGRARRELPFGERGAPRFERCFDALFRGVVGGAGRLALLGGCATWAKARKLTRLAQIARFGVLQGGRIGRRGELGERALDEMLERQCARLALTWLAICANAALSCTARAASTLRSMSICARLSPAMKLE